MSMSRHLRYKASNTPDSVRRRIVSISISGMCWPGATHASASESLSSSVMHMFAPRRPPMEWPPLVVISNAMLCCCRAIITERRATYVKETLLFVSCACWSQVKTSTQLLSCNFLSQHYANFKPKGEFPYHHKSAENNVLSPIIFPRYLITYYKYRHLTSGALRGI